MMKMDELADPESCLNRAHLDEWIFVLLDRDPEAPATIRDWVRRRVEHGHNKATDEKILTALKVAEEMEARLHRAGKH